MIASPDDTARVRDMIAYADEVIAFTAGVDAAALERDLKLERALRYNIGIIGEAASRISGPAETPMILCRGRT